MIRLPTLVAAALAAATAVSARAGAGDGIDTAGALVDTGAAPERGSVLVVPNAPPADPPAVPAPRAPTVATTFSDAKPDFTDTGDGALGAFHASVGATLPGGSYAYSSYVIDPGVTVTYDGAATIRCAGDIVLGGTLRTTAAGASVTLRAAGDIRIEADGTTWTAGVWTSGAGADATLDAAARFATNSADGYAAPTLRADAGAVRVRSSGPAALRAATMLSAGRGDVSVTSYDAEATVVGAMLTARGGACRLEARSRVRVAAFALLSAQGGETALRSLAGEVLVEDATTLNVSAGDLVVESRGTLTATGSIEMNADGPGGVRLVSATGDVRLGEPAADDPEDIAGEVFVFHSGPGDVDIVAAGDVAAVGPFGIDAQDGSIRVSAGRDVRVDGFASLVASAAFEVRARRAAVFAAPSDPDEGPAWIDAGSLSLAAGKLGLVLEAERAGATSGDAEFLAEGPVTLRGLCESAGDLTVRASSGAVDVEGRVVFTRPGRNVSGSLLLETYASPIRAARATLLSGDAARRSGDVRLLRHAARTPSGYVPPLPPSTTPGAELAGDFVVASASLSRPGADGTRALTVRGFAEGGLRGAALEALATFEVGGAVHQSRRVLTRSERLAYATDDFTLLIEPPRRTSGRTWFTLRALLAPGGGVDAQGNGRVDLRFRDAVLLGHAAFTLDRGRFKIGTGRGALVLPPIYVVAVRGAPGAGGSRRLRVDACFAPQAQAGAQDAAMGVGAFADWQVSADEFAAPDRRGRMRCERPVAGIRRVEALPALGRVRFDVDLPAAALSDRAPVTDLPLAVAWGAASRSGRVRLARSGARFVYR